MKKLVLLVAMLVSWASFALADSYMYWQINSADEGFVGFADQYNTIKIQAYGGDGAVDGGFLTMYTTEPAQIGAALGGDYLAAAKSGAAFYALLGNVGSQGYSYAVELWSDDSIIAESAHMSYSELAANSIREISTGGTMEGFTAPWTAGGFHAVPEPNSAMLLMLGLAGLALRRRREVKA